MLHVWYWYWWYKNWDGYVQHLVQQINQCHLLGLGVNAILNDWREYINSTNRTHNGQYWPRLRGWAIECLLSILCKHAKRYAYTLLHRIWCISISLETRFVGKQSVVIRCFKSARICYVTYSVLYSKNIGISSGKISKIIHRLHILFFHGALFANMV